VSCLLAVSDRLAGDIHPGWSSWSGRAS